MGMGEVVVLGNRWNVSMGGPFVYQVSMLLPLNHLLVPSHCRQNVIPFPGQRWNFAYANHGLHRGRNHPSQRTCTWHVRGGVARVGRCNLLSSRALLSFWNIVMP